MHFLHNSNMSDSLEGLSYASKYFQTRLFFYRLSKWDGLYLINRIMFSLKPNWCVRIGFSLFSSIFANKFENSSNDEIGNKYGLGKTNKLYWISRMLLYLLLYITNSKMYWNIPIASITYMGHTILVALFSTILNP